MIRHTPNLVLLAGPNAAGKTTFISGFLRERAEAFQFVNPNEASHCQEERVIPPHSPNRIGSTLHP